MDNDLILFDRLEVIKKTIQKYGEDNFYISFSGGKDSTVLHYLIDQAIPGNRIPRVFINTGIEHLAIVEYVKQLAAGDDRIVLISPKKSIKETLEKVGYPFKSKEHAKKVAQYQATRKLTKYLLDYINAEGKRSGTKYVCPDKLKYQFTEENKLKISHYCCHELKKKPVHEYEKASGRTANITGMLRDEGGARENIPCLVTQGNILKHFHPLAKVTGGWVDWYIETNKIQICQLYKEPYNFKRTGCKGCPFALGLQDQLETMAKYLPAERKQCEFIWGPVYEEYRRLGFRLKPYESEKLF